MNVLLTRFGKEGVNLAVENSFRINIKNETQLPFTINLFNLGGDSNTQTSITTSQIGYIRNLLVTELSYGVLTSPITFEIFENLTNLVSLPFAIGQTTADIVAAVNPVINTQSQSGILSIQPTAGDLTGQYYDIVITTPNITKISFSGSSQGSPSYQSMTYVTNNPFVSVSSTTDINFIQNSEVGNSYKILGIDVYSQNTDQLLEGLNYFYRDVNGNYYSFGTDPLIDPYQPSRASLLMIYVDDFQIHTNTQFRYTIQRETSVYLTFTYVPFGVDDFKEFDKVFYQQVRDRFWMDKKLVEKRRINSMQIE